ncbi:MAG: hypothetical protein HY904_09070 [Deltaproteobacteria bacterium]|nr:hypothetical protein [Deltaproteobacteria bacterium]
MWRIDLDTAALGNLTGRTVFMTNDCTGEAYVQVGPVVAGEAFAMDIPVDEYRIRGRGALPLPTTSYNSYTWSLGCNQGGGSGSPLYRKSETQLVSRPTLTFQAPLHIEQIP